MSTLSQSLLPRDIHTDLRATDHRDAIEELLSPLRGDGRVRDWEEMRESVLANTPVRENGGDSPFILHHGRSDSVTGLVLAAGRSPDGVSGREGKVKLLFLAAVPLTLDNEYLRVLGAISRICRDPVSLTELLAARDSGEFLRVLEKGCLQ
jgi:mannitol/fructose-specific phosphotransferase system IIA component (Ntr-type)